MNNPNTPPSPDRGALQLTRQALDPPRRTAVGRVGERPLGGAGGRHRRTPAPLAARASVLLLVLLRWWHELTADAQARYRAARASGDRGSETVEKAVIVAAMLAGAIALALAINSVVEDYSGRIE